MKKNRYAKWVLKITKRLEKAGYIVTGHARDGIVVELMVQHDAPEDNTPEITLKEIGDLIDDLIGREYLKQGWISQNGEIYVRLLLAFLGA